MSYNCKFEDAWSFEDKCELIIDAFDFENEVNWQKCWFASGHGPHLLLTKNAIAAKRIFCSRNASVADIDRR